ncbi:MAG: hypothetical protein CTY20_15350 [Hyphomicrobium sp.]|jgi:hypothetical protein|nr:MAG: hypothetical protein CTY20_15350 [Hyphomicrobium sp.]
MSQNQTVQPVALLFVVLSLALTVPVGAQTANRDSIADLLTRTGADAKPKPATGSAVPAAAPQSPSAVAPAQIEKDPREGDAAYEQARKLMAAIDSVLQDTAQQRSQTKKLPGRDEFVITPIWTETREDRENKVRALLDSALGIVTDVPVVEVQKKVESLRKNIRDIEDQIVKLKEKQLVAPTDGMLPGVLTDTVASLTNSIENAQKRIEANRAEIKSAKTEIQSALQKSGVQLGPEQVDLLLDSVLSGDLVRLAAVFNAAKAIDGQLAKLMAASGDNMNAARKYFAMHAALFAMLVHAQDATIAKIDTQYLPRLDAILKDVASAKAKTADLMRAENRPDQKRALDSNRDSQKIAEEAARGYRRYLQQQREQIAKARSRATHDLRIADNTFETVEASFQLRNLMREGSSSFEALQKLEAPTFDQIFKNEELRREFENLTRKLDAPTS